MIRRGCVWSPWERRWIPMDDREERYRARPVRMIPGTSCLATWRDAEHRWVVTSLPARVASEVRKTLAKGQGFFPTDSETEQEP